MNGLIVHASNPQLRFGRYRSRRYAAA